MDKELLIDMFYAAPELWYGLGAGFLLLLVLLVHCAFQVLKLRQKNYFLNRDRERYAETLYASRDGYFAFIYPDQKVNDPRNKIMERCSRRLAVMLNLPEGTASGFSEILKQFYKDDVKKIQKYTDLLLEDGVSFEDEFPSKNNKFLRLSGSRINGIDGNIYCDMIWFRDVSFEVSKIDALEKDKEEIVAKVFRFQDLLNNLPYPVWLRDEKLNLALCNKKYWEFSGAASNEDAVRRGVEIVNVNGESVSKNLALVAHAANKTKKGTVNLVKNGERRFMEVIETPFHTEEYLDKICTAGTLIDMTELDELKRNLKIHQNAHLEILGTLGTAFAVFDNQFKLAFYNQAFIRLWGLEDVWLESQPGYSAFLDLLREKRLLPEVPDYLLFKNDETKDFSTIIEPREDLLHLPDGRTIRRVRSPYPMGGLIFAFEDVTDKLAAQTAYNSLLNIQKELLENLFDAVVIFSSTNHLIFYNQAYVKLWQANEYFLKREPSLDELLESQKRFFSKADDWPRLKQDILSHILNMTTKSFVLNRNGEDSVEVRAAVLSDGSVMVSCQQIAVDWTQIENR